VIEIEDNGIGIPPDAMEYIFDRFYRVDKHRSRQVGGTGLGLNITKQLISLHDGRIEVRSEAGLGSVFVVILPKRYRI
jgi:two-component system phosphate regulon sensor histidine kinase PhoR